MSASLKRFLFVIGVIQGLALGHSVYAYTGDFLPNAYKINNTTYPEEYIRAVSSYPVLVETYELANGSLNYLFEIDVSLNIRFPANDGYYNINSTATVNMEYPSNSGVLQTTVTEYGNTQGYNVSLYSYSTSSANRYIRAYFRIMGENKFLYKQASAYFYQLVHFKVKIRTDTETSPTISFTNVSSNISFSQGQSYIEEVIEAIDNSTTAEEIADILNTSGLTLTQVRNIASSLGVANNHLTYIQEYAYEIYNILNNAFPTEASNAMDNAEEKFNNISESLEEYALNQPNINNINSNAQSGFMSQTQDFDSNNIFWYYNWPWLLGILIMVIGIAIISYVLYGGK